MKILKLKTYTPDEKMPARHMDVIFYDAECEMTFQGKVSIQKDGFTNGHSFWKKSQIEWWAYTDTRHWEIEE